MIYFNLVQFKTNERILTMKKNIALMIVLAMILSMASCSAYNGKDNESTAGNQTDFGKTTNSDRVPADKNDNQTTTPGVESPTAEAEPTGTDDMNAGETLPQDNNTYIMYGDYSEGLAWIEYTNVSGDFLGCIDTTGKVVFQLPARGVEHIYQFKNGYSYLIYEDALKIIDTSGIITSTYTIDNNNNVVAYGEGFVLVENYRADFNSAGYTYNICDHIGTVIESFTLEEKESYYKFKYFGKGIFGYSIGSGNWEIYLPNCQEWISLGNGNFYFVDDVALMGIDYGLGFDSNGYRGKLQIIDSNGKIKEVVIPEDLGWVWEAGYIKDEICVLFEGSSNYLLSYNISDNSFSKIPDEYADKVIYDELSRTNLYDTLAFNNGFIALPMRGSDGCRYVMAFDKNWNPAFDPIKIGQNDSFSLSGERLVIKTSTKTTVYDMTGKVVFTSSDVGYSGITEYVENIVCVENEKFPTYLDANGQLLFDKIDMSNVTE